MPYCWPDLYRDPSTTAFAASQASCRSYHRLGPSGIFQGTSLAPSGSGFSRTCFSRTNGLSLGRLPSSDFSRGLALFDNLARGPDLYREIVPEILRIPSYKLGCVDFCMGAYQEIWQYPSDTFPPLSQIA